MAVSSEALKARGQRSSATAAWKYECEKQVEAWFHVPFSVSLLNRMDSAAFKPSFEARKVRRKHGSTVCISSRVPSKRDANDANR